VNAGSSGRGPAEAADAFSLASVPGLSSDDMGPQRLDLIGMSGRSARTESRIASFHLLSGGGRMKIKLNCLQRPLAPQLRHVWMTYLLRQATQTTPFRLVMALVVALLFSLAGGSAGSQTNRTIKIVVAVPPGGNTDIVARVLADQIGRAHGPAMVIENRPGAGSAIATEAVARAAPDGNTLLIAGNSFVVNPHLRKVNYDPLASFEPICYLVTSPTVIVVNAASPYRTLTDLINAARAKPGDLTLASVGPGSAAHIAIEILKRAADVNLTFVPYPGTAPAVNALLGEHVTSVLANVTDVVEQVKAGKLRALATASRTRIEPLPDVPTVAESGYKDYEADIWYGVLAPANTPKETVSQLAGWFIAAMNAADIKPKLLGQGLYPVGLCGADFAAHIRKQYDDYGRVIGAAKIKAE
jgi:tripartite-type tricarboxylate transporter receptor subunit TctC